MSHPKETTGARRFFQVSCIVLFLIVGFIYKVQDNYYDYDVIMHKSILNLSEIESIEQYDACPIPQLDPFDKAIAHLLDKGPNVDCEVKYTLLFESTKESTIIPVNESAFVEENYSSCCYRTVKRVRKGSNRDEMETISETCYKLSFTSPTKIPKRHEFIGIFCRRHGDETLEPVDVHAFVHPKPAKWNRRSVPRDDEKLNVILFGLDATSRMNFMRVMPQSYAFLKGELSGVEMLGYNKVGENTLPNVIAMLTSKMLSELKCTMEHQSLNNCLFIWDEYSKQGYYTSFSEDAPEYSMFNYQRQGFSRQPTDYYLRPLSRWATAKVSSGAEGNSRICYGPRLTFQYLLDYMEKFVDKMSRRRKNFFQFTWATALTHENQGTGRYGDSPLLKSLKWLKDSGHLNNTVLILMSDHGFRVGPFRQTIQGQLEDRLPLLFFVLPDSFQQKYQKAYQNLLINRNKLVTTFDIHATLRDILNPKSIQDDSLRTRQVVTSPFPRQLSLFLRIPKSRTCALAGISMNFCSCNSPKQTALQGPVIRGVANVGVAHINAILLDNDFRCAQLQLKNVTMAQVIRNSSFPGNSYLINFVTEPGGGQFEATIDKTVQRKIWTVRDKITRTNWYGNQSHCVNSNSSNTLKQYCYCLDLD